MPVVVGELIEFYSALWGHLEALDGEDRWLQSLSPLPYKERVLELLSLWENLRHTGLPNAGIQSLKEVLNATLQLASDLRSSREKGEENKEEMAKLHAHQGALEEARDELLKFENTLPGRPASAGLTPVSSHLAAGAG